MPSEPTAADLERAREMIVVNPLGLERTIEFVGIRVHYLGGCFAEKEARACAEKLRGALAQALADARAEGDAAGVKREREACAKLAECFDLGTPIGHAIAHHIRARGESKP